MPEQESRYTVRVSSRARNVRIQASLAEGVVVVVPKGFDQRRISEVVAANSAWLDRATAHLDARHRQLVAAGAYTLPGQVTLRAVQTDWQVEYRRANRRSIRPSAVGERRVTVSAPDDDGARSVLLDWLRSQGRERLAPWLRELSIEHGLSVRRVSIRNQKTRWGSCSRHGNINLNFKLLFLPPPVVRYVMLHELCHTLHLNHSRRFWDEVAAREPDYRALAAELRNAHRYLPPWLAVAP